MTLIRFALLCFWLTSALSDEATNTAESLDNFVDSELELDTANSYRVPKAYGRRRMPITPWNVTPNNYTAASYGGPLVGYDRRYDQKSIYYRFLTVKAYSRYVSNCRGSSYGGYPTISNGDLQNAFAHAIAYLNQYKRQNEAYRRTGKYIRAPYRSAYARSQSSSYINKRSPAYSKEMSALFMEQVAQYLTKHHCLTPEHTNLLLPRLNSYAVVGTGYADAKCRYAYNNPVPESESCKYYNRGPFRTIDGKCNNLRHKYWGASDVAHLSLLPKMYYDGISSPRSHSVTGLPLPNARRVSNYIHHPFDSRAYYTNMKMLFGQFMNHDISHTPQMRSMYSEGMIDCCKQGRYNDDTCYPIRFSRYDAKSRGYADNGCMGFVRSRPAALCNLGPRQQVNEDTSYCDISSIYGKNRHENYLVRSGIYGQLKTMQDAYGQEILPLTNKPWANQCQNSHCFRAGDSRVNQHPALTSMFVMFTRHHNNIARALYKMYPRWDDNTLFEVARHITISQYQHITYAEYFPIVMGNELMNYYDLRVPDGYSKYNPYTDPTTWNEYTTAACRFGHSQIPNWFSIAPVNNYGPKSNYRYRKGFYLRDNYFNSNLTMAGHTDGILLGLAKDYSMLMDPWLETDVRDYLYRDGKNMGGDLAAFNIQRGRDHGIPGYVYYLEYCYNIRVDSWKDLAYWNLIPSRELYLLKKLYPSVHDIDLWTGGMAEKPYPGADVSPIFACIIGIQAHHLKMGDRFFYSHKGVNNPSQLAAIKYTKLSDILCTTTRVSHVQRHLFFPASNYGNPVIDCKSAFDITQPQYLKLFANFGAAAPYANRNYGVPPKSRARRYGQRGYNMTY